MPNKIFAKKLKIKSLQNYALAKYNKFTEVGEK